MRDRLPLIAVGVVGLIVGGAIGAAAFGGDDTKTEAAQTVTNTTTNTQTKTVRAGSRKAKTVTRVRTVTSPSSSSTPRAGDEPGGGPTRTVQGEQTFSGNGFKRIGTLKIKKRSVMEWTNTGRVFSVISQTALHVSSQKKKGTARLYQGTYPDFRVAAIGRWTLTIRPR
jgi:hypothetical protein